REIGFAPRCTQLRSFAAKNSPTVEATMKSEFPSRARVELFNLVLPNSADKTKSSGRQALPVLSVYIDLDIERVCYETSPLVSSFFLLFYENSSPQIQSSYQAIDCSGGRRSHRCFLSRPFDRGRGRSLPDADRTGRRA